MNAPSAKGLFQKAIVESGSYLTSFMDPSVSRRIAAAVLEELHLDASQVDSLQTIPYERLNNAAKKAMGKVTAALRSEGKPVQGFGLMWGPNLDGTFLPYQPDAPQAIELSKNIPLLVGSTKNEFTPFIPGSRDMTMDAAKASVQKKYGDKADAYLAAVLKAYPGTTKPSDYIDIDNVFRPGAIRQANQKAVPGAAPVYMYLFAWQSPVLDGVFKAMHCMEIPFVFDNIARCEEMTGGGRDAHTLSDKMSSAWSNFARTGNPNAKGLPNWPAYTAENGAVMIFDNKCEVRNFPDKELMSIVTGK
jgi:para-nitrobenzyl esterase